MAELTPLHEWAARAGAAFREDAGWLLPAHFGDPASEYRHALRDAALFEVSHRGKLEMTGPDAAGFLHNLCTNDVRTLPPGSGREAFLTTGQAKVVAHVLIYHVSAPESLWLDVAPGMAAKVAQHLEHYHITEQFDLGDRTHASAQFHLAGPAAATVLKRALPGVPHLEVLQNATALAGAAGCQVRRNEPLGVPGYDVLCPQEHAVTVWQALNDAGAAPAGLETYQVLRVEAGTPEYGLDIDESNLPQEVGRTERAVSFTKGCYIGQETVARIRTYGHVNRSLVGLRLAGQSPATRGARLWHQGKEVGQVTSSVLSLRFGAIALAYVRRGSNEPGTGLEVEAGESLVKAEVVLLPFSGGAPEG